MPKEQPRFGRFDQRDEPRSCASGDQRPHDGCPLCVSQVLRPYRAVRRYRGDQIARALTPDDWCTLWKLQTSDVSWPESRQG
jgi:hypothetical protein